MEYNDLLWSIIQDDSYRHLSKSHRMHLKQSDLYLSKYGI